MLQQQIETLPIAEIDLGTVTMPIKVELLTMLALINQLREVTSREDIALKAVSLRSPATPQQVAVFGATQLLLVGGSGVPETTQRIDTLFSDIQANLRLPKNQGAKVRYIPADGNLVVEVPGTEAVPVAIQSVARARDLFPTS